MLRRTQTDAQKPTRRAVVAHASSRSNTIVR
jgi:hypothetical protein